MTCTIKYIIYTDGMGFLVNDILFEVRKYSHSIIKGTYLLCTSIITLIHRFK